MLCYSSKLNNSAEGNKEKYIYFVDNLCALILRLGFENMWVIKKKDLVDLEKMKGS